MIKPSLSHSITSFKAAMDKAHVKLAQAEAQAINEIAKATQAALTEGIKASIKGPTKTTENSVKLWPARPGQAAKGYPIEARVFIQDKFKTKGTPPAAYLQAQAHGGERQLKPYEQFLANKALMLSGGYLKPSAAALGKHGDRFGNLPLKLINRILKDLETKRNTKAERQDITYVFAQPKGKSLGIWERNNTRRTMRPILIFKQGKQEYKERFHFHAIAEEAVKTNAPKCLKAKISNVFR